MKDLSTNPVNAGLIPCMKHKREILNNRYALHELLEWLSMKNYTNK